MKETNDKSIKRLNDSASTNQHISKMVIANHSLDDAIINNLTHIIHLKMHKLRKINLSGLNIGDEFAEKFSLVLS